MTRILEGLQISGVTKIIKVIRSGSYSTLPAMQVEESRAINIGKFQSSMISVCASLSGNTRIDNESTLTVRIKNEGKSAINSFKLVAEVSGGSEFINSGEIYGEPTVKKVINSLAPGRSITFKVAVLPSNDLMEDEISVQLSHAKSKQQQDQLNAQLPLVKSYISRKTA